MIVIYADTDDTLQPQSKIDIIGQKFANSFRSALIEKNLTPRILASERKLRLEQLDVVSLL